LSLFDGIGRLNPLPSCRDLCHSRRAAATLVSTIVRVNSVSGLPGTVQIERTAAVAISVGVSTRHQQLIRRTDRDYSQILRRAFQAFFFFLNVWIGVQFYLWVQWVETGGLQREVSRPAGVEGWLPIEGLMQMKYFVLTGAVPRIHPAGFFLFVAFLVISFLFRKAFCGWLCPIGTVSEYLWRAGRLAFRRNYRLPRWVDLALRSLKYIALALFAYAVAGMSAEAIEQFLGSPYGLIVDVRMLNFFRYLGGSAAYVILGLLLASLFVPHFWCRYLCPYGAFLGMASALSPLRIRRKESTCIDCAKCAKACPASLPVDKLVEVRSPECSACLECIAVCPAKDTLIAAGPYGFKVRRAMPSWGIAAGIAVAFFALVGYAKLSGHWDTSLPKQVYIELIPYASELEHPMP
jgi:polyferredoxin